MLRSFGSRPEREGLGMEPKWALAFEINQHFREKVVKGEYSINKFEEQRQVLKELLKTAESSLN